MIELINDDCLNYIKKIDDKTIDLVVTDPPYFFAAHGRGGMFGSRNRKYHDQLEDSNITKGFNLDILQELKRVMKKTNIYIWCSKEQIKLYLDFFSDCNMDLIAWHKTNPVPTCNNKYLSDTEYCLFFREEGVKVYGSYETKKKFYVTPTNKKDKIQYNHPTVKPLDIISNLVFNSSKEGDIVLDPFMGSGTTGAVCKELNRNFIGIEIDKKYYDTAVERIDEISSFNDGKQLSLF